MLLLIFTKFKDNLILIMSRRRIGGGGNERKKKSSVNPRLAIHPQAVVPSYIL